MTTEAIRAQQNQEWNIATPGFLEYRENFAGPTKKITEQIVQRVNPQEGQQGLDLGCGIAIPTATLAELVGPDGFILGLDFSEAVAEAARSWSVEKGIQNVDFRAIPSEVEIGTPASAFDFATCQMALQFMPEPVAALTAVRKSLKPGGKLAATTLASPERCMTFQVSSEVIARHAVIPGRQDEGPGPLGLRTAEQLKQIFEEAGFIDVSVDAFDSDIVEADSPEQVWDIFEKTMGGLINALSYMLEGQRQALRDDAVATIGERYKERPIRMGGEVLVAVGTAPQPSTEIPGSDE